MNWGGRHIFIFLREDTTEMRRQLLDAWRTIEPQMSMEFMSHLLHALPPFDRGVDLFDVMRRVAEAVDSDGEVTDNSYAVSHALRKLRLQRISNMWAPMPTVRLE